MRNEKHAQDSIRIQPQHYTIDFENDDVRVMRIKYGPREKPLIHEYVEGVLVFLTDHHVRFTYPNGKTLETVAKAGDTLWEPGIKYLPENLSDTPLEMMLVEQKNRHNM